MSSGQHLSTNGQDSEAESHLGSWLNQAQQGSREAQAQLLQVVRPYLLAVAEDQLASEIRPKLAASDIVQNTVLLAWQDFGEFRGQSRAELVGWLQTILSRCAADGARQHREIAKRDIRRERSLDQIKSEFGLALADSCSTPSGHAMANEERQKMECAVRRMSSQYEQVIRLRNELGLTYEEMGVALSCSKNAARKLWLRAVKELGRELNRDDSDER
jgi:RNA polymerase sigma-70 factor (ECF subfamily)